MVDEQDKSSEDDPLEDIDLDDADLDALLEDVDAEAATDKPASLSASTPENSSSDDEELLNDDDLFEILDEDESASGDAADDLLGNDLLGNDDLGDGGNIDDLLDDAQSSDVDEDLDDLLGDADGSASEIPDTVPDELIAELDSEDGTEELDLIDGGNAEDLDVDATDLLGDLDGDDASGDPLADVDDLVPAAGVEESAEEKKVGKKVGKKSFAKKGKKKGAEKPAREKLAPAAKAPRGNTLTFVCSECYTEISVAADYSEEGVTCPDCLHVGKKPDDNFLRTVSITKSGERKSVVLATVVGILMVACFVGLLFVQSAYLTPELPKEDLQTWTYGLLGGGSLFSLLFLWLLWRFEGNRWEVYF